MKKIISLEAINRRNIQVDKIDNLTANFASNSELIENQFEIELKTIGVTGLLDHLRLCGKLQ